MSQSVTVIGENIRVAGQITGDEDLSVFGAVEGSVRLSESLLVEPSGVVRAEVAVRAAIISGIVIGNITAAELVEITAEGRMIGNIHAPRVILNDGATFRGHITMAGLEDVQPASAEASSRTAQAPSASRSTASSSASSRSTSSASASSRNTPAQAATQAASSSARRPYAAAPAPPPARTPAPAPPPAPPRPRPAVPTTPPPAPRATQLAPSAATTATATVTLDEGDDDPSGPPEPRGALTPTAPEIVREALTPPEPAPAPPSAPEPTDAAPEPPPAPAPEADEHDADEHPSDAPELLPPDAFRALGWNKARSYIKKHDIELEYTNLDELIEAYARHLAAR